MWGNAEPGFHEAHKYLQDSSRLHFHAWKCTYCNTCLKACLCFEIKRCSEEGKKSTHFQKLIFSKVRGKNNLETDEYIFLFTWNISKKTCFSSSLRAHAFSSHAWGKLSNGNTDTAIQSLSLSSKTHNYPKMRPVSYGGKLTVVACRFRRASADPRMWIRGPLSGQPSKHSPFLVLAIVSPASHPSNYYNIVFSCLLNLNFPPGAAQGQPRFWNNRSKCRVRRGSVVLTQPCVVPQTRPAAGTEQALWTCSLKNKS